ncbi:hypothetical protein GGI26_002444 [Coemansia sp. RSA 1358]|uniref:PDEase domain-containing protein n=1 Tax=Coemansia umbellata TaxID=1424467 RepID=A0ABQ8PG78_9FUNG|nr:hypothetical protein EDC05_005207 [Coemansia umbellata]KAJ2623406.1 hypothetical protein GGI26_002444 [Coemansia sp. RSA 1358]
MNSYIIESWASVGLDFDPWSYSRAEKHGILLSIFKHLNMLAVLELPPSDVLDFCLDIESLYSDVPYHSFNHAVDVVVKLYYVLNDLQASAYLASYDIASLIISGLCHDAGHPGLNNLFQKNANTKLAQRYPNAVLERYSMDLAEEYIKKHRLFRNVENLRDPMYSDSTTTEIDVASRMIFSIRTAILNTDMTRHFEVVEECKTLVSELSKKARRISEHEAYQRKCNAETNSSSDTSTVDKPTNAHPSIRPTKNPNKVHSEMTMLSRARSPSAPVVPKRSIVPYPVPVPKSNAHLDSEPGKDPKALALSTDKTDNTQGSNTPSSENSSADSDRSKVQRATRRLNVRRSISMSDALLDSSQRQSLIGIILHAVDVFNPVLPWPMCKKWSDLMNVESFRQGELEKALSLPISPNMDRETTDQRQVSLDFGNIIIRPFFTELVSLFPVEDLLLPALEENLQRWSRLSSDTNHEINPPAGANSHIYSWPAEQILSPSSCASISSAFSEGRRLSVAAGTVDIPPSRLEMIRRHSHEGFEALHRRMVGRLFSKHLERIQERRKVSYTGSNHRLPLLERQHQRPPYIRTAFADGNQGFGSIHAGRSRAYRVFDSDMLSPVTEASCIDDQSTPTSSTTAAHGTEGSGSARQRLIMDSPTAASNLTPSTAGGHSDSPCCPPVDHPMIISADNHVRIIQQGPASASLETRTPGIPIIMSRIGHRAMPSEVEQLSNYRIDPLHEHINGRPYRSTSLDPTILSNMPSTYPSLSDKNSNKLQQHEVSDG